MNIQEFGSRISALRKEKGWTQDNLAEKVGVTYQAVSKWETAQSYPDITLLPLLADVLEVSLDELFGRTWRGTEPMESDAEPSGTERISISPEQPQIAEGTLYGALYLDGRLLSWKEADWAVPLVLEYSGALHGSIECAGDVRCINSSINGSVRAGGDVRLENCGDIRGNLNAEGDICCGDVSETVTAGGDVSCGNVGRDVNAEGDVNCGGVGCDVNAEGDVNCGIVGGSVHAEGDVVYKDPDA